MLPAHQRFGADDQFCCIVDLRLVIENQFLLFDGTTQTRLQRQTLERPRIHVTSVESVVVASELPCLVQGRAAVLENRLRILTVIREDADSYARRHVNLLLLQMERRPKCFGYSLGQLDQRLRPF